MCRAWRSGRALRTVRHEEDVMNAMPRRFVGLFLALWLCLQGAMAQSTASGSWSAVEALAPGSDISVKTTQGLKLQGTVDSVSEIGLVIWSSERRFPGRATVRREIPREEVREIRMNRRGLSTLAGAAAGAGLGIAIGAPIDAQARSNEDRGVVTAVLALLGA